MLLISKHFYLRKFELYMYIYTRRHTNNLQEHIKYCFVMTAEQTLQPLTLFYTNTKYLNRNEHALKQVFENRGIINRQENN